MGPWGCPMGNRAPPVKGFTGTGYPVPVVELVLTSKNGYGLKQAGWCGLQVTCNHPLFFSHQQIITSNKQHSSQRLKLHVFFFFIIFSTSESFLFDYYLRLKAFDFDWSCNPWLATMNLRRRTSTGEAATCEALWWWIYGVERRTCKSARRHEWRHLKRNQRWRSWNPKPQTAIDSSC